MKSAKNELHKSRHHFLCISVRFWNQVYAEPVRYNENAAIIRGPSTISPVSTLFIPINAMKLDRN